MLKKWSLNSRSIEVLGASSDKDLSDALNEHVSERASFSYDMYRVTVPRYFYRFIGVDGDVDAYYNYLFKLDERLSKAGDLYLPVKDGFDVTIDHETSHRLNRLWSILLSMSEINGTTVLTLMEQERLLVDFPNETLSIQLRNNLKGLIEYYFELHNNEIDPQLFKQFLFCLIIWINRYVPTLFMDFDYIGVNPKVLFYGDIAQEEVYFLIYLSSLGCDVLLFNPLRDGDFASIDTVGFSSLVEYPRKIDIQPFPTKLMATRANTLAYNAREGIRDMMEGESIGFFTPWQLIDHKTSTVTLKTTYDELFIIGQERGMLRPEWKIEGNTVFTPNLFAKVSGTHSNLSKYWREIWSLNEKPSSILVKSLPVTGGAMTNGIHESRINGSSGFRSLADTRGYISEERLPESPLWGYRDLPLGIQRRAAHEVAWICSKFPFSLSINAYEKDLLKERAFHSLMNIEGKFIQMLLRHDLPQEVPTIVIYNNEENGDLSFEDATLLLFMNRMGIDIILFNPSGKNDIEKFLPPQYYDTHRLEQVTFNLPYKEKSLIGRLFK